MISFSCYIDISGIRSPTGNRYKRNNGLTMNTPSPRLQNRARIAPSSPETIRYPTTDVRTSHTINITPPTNRTYQGLKTCMCFIFFFLVLFKRK